MLGFGVGLPKVRLAPNAALGELFANSGQGGVYDPPDLSTQYQESTGATPVTAVGQPVGMILDKRLGAVRGAEALTNGDFSNGSTGWTLAGAAVVNSVLQVDGTLGRFAVQSSVVTAGQWYEVALTYTCTSGINLRVNTQATNGAEALVIWAIPSSSSGSLRGLFKATSTFFAIEADGGLFTGSIDNVSIKLIDGNHATQATAASRPTLSARHNLLTTTNLTSGTWVVSDSVASGVEGAYVITNTAANTAHSLYGPAAFVTGARCRLTVRLSAASTSRYISLRGEATAASTWPWVTVDMQTGTLQANAAVASSGISARPEGGYEVWFEWVASVSGGDVVIATANTSAAPATSAALGETYVGAGQTAVVAGVDARAAADAALAIPAYQRVTTATDYDTVGFPLGLDFDGSDDSLASATGGGGTTGFFFCAAVRVAGGAGTDRMLFDDRGANTGHIVYIGTGNQLAYVAGNGAAFLGPATGAGTLPVGETHVVTAWDDGTNLNVQVDNGTIASLARPAIVAGATGFTIGKIHTAAAGYFNGRMFSPVYRYGTPVSAALRERIKRLVAASAASAGKVL